MLPCKSETDACARADPCRLKKELDKGYRTAEYVEEKCEELLARREGFISAEEAAELLRSRRE